MKEKTFYLTPRRRARSLHYGSDTKKMVGRPIGKQDGYVGA